MENKAKEGEIGGGGAHYRAKEQGRHGVVLTQKKKRKKKRDAAAGGCTKGEHSAAQGRKKGLCHSEATRPRCGGKEGV